MEPITHLLTGYHLSRFLKFKIKYPTIAVLIGAIFPDIDHIVILFKKAYYLQYHRTFTHSLITTPFFAFLLAIIIKFWDKKGKFFTYFSLISIGIFSHLLLDLIVPYGIKLFYPFGRWYAFNWVCVIDIPLLIILLISFFIEKLNFFSEKKISLIVLLFMINFFLFRSYLNYKVVNHFHSIYPKNIKIMALPTPFNPFEWKVIVELEKEYKYFYFNFLKNKLYFKKHFLKNPEKIAFLKNLPLSKLFLEWAIFPIVDSSEKIFYLKDLRFFHPKYHILTVRIIFDKKTKETFLFKAQ